MNRCPNHKCQQACDAKHSFCFSCGIAIRLCRRCQQEGKLAINRADGFYCRYCGSPLSAPQRGMQTQTAFVPDKEILSAPATRLTLNERSDSFPLSFSTARLWLLTSNNHLKIIENRADGLGLYSPATGRHAGGALEDLQTTVSYLEPQIAPVIFRDRLLLFGTRKIFSFSIHPHSNRWLQDRREAILPEKWQLLFNSEVVCHTDRVELPVMIGSGQFALLGLSTEAVTGASPISAESLSQPITALPVGPLDQTGQYYWAKDLKKGTGLVFYLRRNNPGPSGVELVPVNCPPLLFFARPFMVGSRLYAITAENRLIEFGLQRQEVVQQRKLNQVEHGARYMLVTRDKIIVAIYDGLFFFDQQTGQLLSVAPDIDASHLFVDREGVLLAINRNGRLIMMNPENPLDRWGNEDATSDDSRVFDAFIAHNSLYSLSENGEVCRFDFN